MDFRKKGFYTRKVRTGSMANPRMSWDKLLSTTRMDQENVPETKNNDRSAFKVDIDRIMFSGAFRRLSRKTPVHPLAANDHVHTRLTHNLKLLRLAKLWERPLGLNSKMIYRRKLQRTTWNPWFKQRVLRTIWVIPHLGTVAKRE